MKADFEELNSKNTALKDFVNVSLKPKLAAQKKDLEKKSEETKQLKDKAAELGKVSHILSIYQNSILLGVIFVGFFFKCGHL